MEQLISALISAAIVVVGAIATFVSINLTNKSAKTNNNELVKKIDEINKKYTQIKHKLNEFEVKNEKRLSKLEEDNFFNKTKRKL